MYSPYLSWRCSLTREATVKHLHLKICVEPCISCGVNETCPGIVPISPGLVVLLKVPQPNSPRVADNFSLTSQEKQLCLIAIYE